MGNRFREKKVEEGLAQPMPSEVVESSASAVPNGGSVEAEGKPRKGGKKKRGVGYLLRGDILGDQLVVRQIPLLILCLFYLLLIVGNRYRIEELSREKEAIEERLNYRREARIQLQKQYQQSVKISQIAEDLTGTGVGITAGPPYEIEK